VRATLRNGAEKWVAVLSALARSGYQRFSLGEIEAKKKMCNICNKCRVAIGGK
jgi:hypothetical protein